MRESVKYQLLETPYNRKVSKKNVIIFSILCTMLVVVSSFRYSDEPTSFEGLYRRRSEVKHVDCARIVRNDHPYIKLFRGKNRIKQEIDENLDMTCSAVTQRIIPPVTMKSLSSGVAFARIVYTDYELIEHHVKSSYHPQNVFCFAIDKKANKTFHRKMRSLASCIPNIILLFDEISVDSKGHNVNQAHYNCLKALINKPGWNYVILLQNHDMIGKSVYELERIYQLLGGANDVEISAGSSRINKKDYLWDPRSLKLFKNESNIDDNQLNNTLSFGKGAVQASISRAAVEWMTIDVDLTTMIRQLNSGRFGVDEMLIQSLQLSSFLKMPGHFTDECLENNIDAITRMSQWRSAANCPSGNARHFICILGVEDLSSIAQFPNIMFNKMMPSFDITAIDCLGELLYNRTFLGQTDHVLEEEYYSNMPNVIYHKHHLEPDYKLNCNTSVEHWGKRLWPIL